MRALLPCGLLAALGLVAPNPGIAYAGIYNFAADPAEEKREPDFLGKFQFTLTRLKSIGMPKVEVDNPTRRRYRLQVDLAAKANLGQLTVEQKISLSAALIRTRNYSEAISLLMPLARQERENFFVHANLGTAYQLSGGQESRALDSLGQALAVWPKDWGRLKDARRTAMEDHLGFSQPVYVLFREFEYYHHKLVKLRMRERGGAFENVDALFDDGNKPPTPVKFIGESGDFEPGKIAKTEKAKLDAVRKFPSDPGPIDIVQQLLIWLPDDQRLLWLLGELYNAAADLTDVEMPAEEEDRKKILKKAGDDFAAAKYIFETLGKDAGGLRTKEFWSRRQVLLNAPGPEQTGQTSSTGDAKPVSRIGIDWRSLWVGLGTGAAVALFTLWQVKEWRRRRKR